MEASKENCREAIKIVEELYTYNLLSRDEQEDNKLLGWKQFIREFLQAAEKRLPSQEAITRGKSRRKIKQQV